MTKTFWKNIRRSITGSIGRYVAILLIIMLGVAFLAGLRLTRPAMTATATAYIREQKLYDLRLLSTVGFDETDVEAIAAAEGVSHAEGSYTADFISVSDGVEHAYRTHLLTETLNRPLLTAGRMPETGAECLADAERFSEDMIGQSIVVSDTGDGESLLKYTAYTVVGLADVPYYLNMERGTTSLGDGSLDSFLLLTADGYDSEYFTEMYVQNENELELYSDAYEDFIDTLSDTVEIAATEAVTGRMDDLVADAEQDIADAERKLSDKRAEAETELADAKAQLDDAAREIEDGEAELADAKAQLDDAAAQLNEAAAQIQPGFSSWQGALDAGLQQYNDGQAALDSAIAEGRATLAAALKDLEDGEAQYTEGKAQYDAGEAQYAEGKAQYDVGLGQYESGLADWQSGMNQLESGFTAYQQGASQLEASRAAYEQQLAAFNAAKDAGELSPEEIEAQQAALDAAKTALDQSAAQLAATKETLDATRMQLDAAKSTLDAKKPELDAAAAVLDETRATLDASAEKLAQTRLILDAGRSEYDSGVAQLEQQRATQQGTLHTAYLSLQQFRSGIGSYNSGYASYEEGVQALADGRAEYEDGVREYEEGVQEFDEQIADAEEQIADAKRELADLDTPEIFVLTRSANTGYVSFEGDSEIVQNLSALFPLFFFLIAALVCSTTMTRMIDEDRSQIGTMRALGYSRASILTKYLLYSGSAALFGCLIGYFGGGYLFPYVIWNAYGMLYDIPGFINLYDFGLFAASLAASLVCSAGVTFVTCRHEMLSTPADLIRPKSPAAGKRIWLERVAPVWSRLKFLHKVTLRNIFRFKKRMIMMLFGIAGCTALVLTGFGVRDSVANIGNFQFDDIQRYDISATLDEPVTDEWLAARADEFGSDLEAEAAALMCSGELSGPGATKTVYFVASDDANIADIFDLHLNGETVEFPGDGAVAISEKLASQTGVSVGDTVTVSISDTDKAELTVSGIVENYVQNYVYMTGGTYEHAFDDAYEPETLLLRAAEGADEYALAAVLSNTDGVTAVSVITDMRRMIDNMMQSMNYIVLLILVSAGALAFIVLFNLGNINLTERVREIATIKVLGFHSRETGAYVFRENMILAAMGIVLGLPLGVALHAFVMAQIKVDLVSFKLVIEPMSYLLTVALVLLFSVVTDFIMRRKIARIDMAESLKSVE